MKIWDRFCIWCIHREVKNIEKARLRDQMIYGSAYFYRYVRPFWDLRRYITGPYGMKHIKPKNIYIWANNYKGEE